MGGGCCQFWWHFKYVVRSVLRFCVMRRVASTKEMKANEVAMLLQQEADKERVYLCRGTIELKLRRTRMKRRRSRDILVSNARASPGPRAEK